jgi:hypothetical protein
MWLVLQILLYKDILDLPELSSDKKTKYALVLSTVLTMFSLAEKLISVSTQSHALKEDTLIYLMSKMTANSKWIPFQRFIINRNLRHCIDFDKIAVQYPAGLSKVTGFY